MWPYDGLRFTVRDNQTNEMVLFVSSVCMKAQAFQVSHFFLQTDLKNVLMASKTVILTSDKLLVSVCIFSTSMFQIRNGEISCVSS